MKIKKILLIRSSHYADNGTLVKSNKFLDKLTIANLAEMGLPLLAAYTPNHIEVEMVDDCMHNTPFDTDAEVIGISAMLIHLSRAVFLAQYFKKQGKIVIMGGFLPTQHPEKVIDHVDSLCVGEGDAIWPQMIKDIENKCLKKKYVADHKVTLENIPTPRYDLIKKDRYFDMNTCYPVQATRGCPHHCDYCSVIAFYGKTYRLRPIDDVVRDIKAHGSRYMYFVDDNLFDHRTYAKKLMIAIKECNVLWGVQSTINIAKDNELLNLAYEAGCRLMMVGIETVVQKNLNSIAKEWAHSDTYKENLQKIQAAGICVHALIIFGLPEDTIDVFNDSVKFLEECGVAAAEFFVFTPYPATPCGKRYLKDGKIIDHNLAHYREPYVVFKHPSMSPYEIQNGFRTALRKFYSLRGIIKRAIYGNCKNKPYQVALNLYYWFKIKRNIIPTHFQRSNFSFYSADTDK